MPNRVHWILGSVLTAVTLAYSAPLSAGILVRFPKEADPERVEAVTQEIERTSGEKTRGVVAIDAEPQKVPTDPPRASTVALEQARAAYKELDLERTLSLAEEAEKSCLDSLPVIACRRLLFDARMLMGMAAAAQKKPDESAQAFRSAHAADPARVADPRLYPPQIVRSFSRACAAGDRAAGIRVLFSSSPPGASFKLDGAEINTSNKADLGPGRHVFEASLLGYESAHRIVDVDLAASAQKKVVIELVPLPLAEAWEEMRKSLSTPLPNMADPGLATLFKRFEIDRLIVLTPASGASGGYDVSLIETGKVGSKSLPNIALSGESLPSDFIEGLKDALGMESPPEPEPVTVPKRELYLEDDPEEDDESSSIRLRPEDMYELGEEDEGIGIREVITSPWFWISVGAVAALVGGVVIITQVD
ncbi:MAG: hypothetical protein GY847_10830 [Proteobacteria bacterium]|nr:hypothetical protein [Pseudomonadota bacterium]